MCREYALSEGYQVVGEYAEDDRGVSGADFDAAELNRALAVARGDGFEVLVTRELARFARALAKQLIVEREFLKAGVRVEYVRGKYPDTMQGRLQKNIEAVIAEYNREDTAWRMTNGRRRRAEKGNVIPSAHLPYGYQEATVDGKRTFSVRAGGKSGSFDI